MSDESCNLPSYCNCSACQWWTENGWDASLDPEWLNRDKEEDDE